ncbi:hypothetical protein JMJ77_0000421 [Colletotrichum scovillei]|uniref:Uncharacterized protein n=1 Tax=Colletotrichum scovillei TaxID=1209932 RepID=A0A9P7R9J0_9PEZI|nr:hypothetical protein JMJ77_0000421 [Colletotrichum scovillei]KAG7071623.1 hypothetical protein JMJ76_0004494 [Colletotrichum scovillei]KAG7079900.1 hypothetical protein JMJ78_0007004 [Colletotrichum scovillei]
MFITVHTMRPENAVARRYPELREYRTSSSNALVRYDGRPLGFGELQAGMVIMKREEPSSMSPDERQVTARPPPTRQPQVVRTQPRMVTMPIYPGFTTRNYSAVPYEENIDTHRSPWPEKHPLAHDDDACLKRCVHGRRRRWYPDGFRRGEQRWI